MTEHLWFEEHRTAYLARSLDREETATFEDHLARCADCREAVRELERELAWLPMGVQPATVRPGLRRQILNRVLGVNRWQWNRMTSLAVAASLLLAVLAYGMGRAQSGRDRARLTALEDTVSVMRSASKIVQANFEMDNKPGGLLIFADERTHRWNVVVHGLPPSAPGQVYQFWFIQKDGMVRGEVVQPDSLGPTFMMMGMPPNGREVMGAALTVEPMHDQADQPRGKELAHIML